MKKLVVVLVTMLVASSAFAVLDNTPNTIGFYWDESADVVNDVYGPYKIGHLVITNPSFPTFKALECNLRSDFGSNGAIRAFPAAFGDVVALGTLPQIVFGLGAPVVTSPVFTVCDIILGNGSDSRYGEEPCNFYLNPADAPTINGAILAIGQDGGEFIELTPIVPYGAPIAALNGENVIATEEATFGSVKSLYR